MSVPINPEYKRRAIAAIRKSLTEPVGDDPAAVLITNERLLEVLMDGVIQQITDTAIAEHSKRARR